MSTRDITTTYLAPIPSVASQAVIDFAVFAARERVNLGERRFKRLFSTPAISPKINSTPISWFVYGSHSKILL